MKISISLIIIFSIIISIIMLQPSVESNFENDPAFGAVWKLKSYDLSIKIDNEYLNMGQYLHIESDGFMSKEDIPEKWKVEKLYTTNSSFVLELQGDKKIEIPRSKMGPMSFEITECSPPGTRPSDINLENIWLKYSF